MNVTLIQHAQHDVDGNQGGQNQQRLVGERASKAPPFPENSPGHGRHAQLLRAALMALTASPSDAPGAKLNETVTTGNCP